MSEPSDARPRRRWLRRVGLRTQVALGFGLLSLVVALLVSVGTYVFARVSLVQQREASALTRTLIDARVVQSGVAEQVANPAAPADIPAVLDSLPSLFGSQPMVRVGDSWFIRGVSVSPSDLPQSLLDLAEESGGGRQTFAVGGDPYLGVAVTDPDAPGPPLLYLEVFPLRDVQTTLTSLLLLLAGASTVAFLVGAGLGRWVGARIMRPLRDIATGAGRISQGDTSVRLEPVDDPDLAPIVVAFNDMAGAVESRIARERRFTANVSHELRSPLTTIVGTSELLESRRDMLPDRESRLVSMLGVQVRRFARTMVDLLEISRIEADDQVQRAPVDLVALVEEVLDQRGLDPGLVRGAGPVVARTDARRVERIVANLVDNATTHGGGVVAVSVDRVAGRVRVRVDDDGPGVPEAERAGVFEPFMRGAAAHGRQGAGLGLAIAREQSLRLGAEVSVEEAPGGGARFVMLLPALEVFP